MGAMSAISLASRSFSLFLFVNGNNAFMRGVDAANQHILQLWPRGHKVLEMYNLDRVVLNFHLLYNLLQY